MLILLLNIKYRIIFNAAKWDNLLLGVVIYYHQACKVI